MVVTGGVIAVGAGVPIVSGIRGSPPASLFPIEIVDVTGKQTLGKLEIDYSAGLFSKTGAIANYVVLVTTQNFIQSVTTDIGTVPQKIQGVITVDVAGVYVINIKVADLTGNSVAETKTLTVTVA